MKASSLESLDSRPKLSEARHAGLLPATIVADLEENSSTIRVKCGFGEHARSSLRPARGLSERPLKIASGELKVAYRRYIHHLCCRAAASGLFGKSARSRGRVSGQSAKSVDADADAEGDAGFARLHTDFL